MGRRRGRRRRRSVEGFADDSAWDESPARSRRCLGEQAARRVLGLAEPWPISSALVLLRPGSTGGEGPGSLPPADRVVVVTTAAPPPPTAEAPDGCDVLFLEPPTTEDVAAWFARSDVRAHHVVPVDTELTAAAGRVARRLTGQSLGLVLSGGGARAFAHIGVLEVLDGEGLEVDRLGGCSMGAFIGAMAALGWKPETMVEVCRRELAQRAPFSDYTIPRHALIRARRAASMLRRIFGELALEQLARPLYTISADLLSSRMVVHRTGSIVDTVGASMAIPGLAPRSRASRSSSSTAAC